MSRKKLRVAFAALGILVASTQGAMSADSLFKGYALFSPIAQYSESNGHYDCSKALNTTARCLDGLDFLGEKFKVVLTFNEERLTAVTLFGPYSDDLFNKAMGTFVKSFTLVAMSDGVSTLDLVDLAGKEPPKKFAEKIAKFERTGLEAKNLKLNFYSGKYSVKNKKLDLASLLTSLPSSTRNVELIVGKNDKAASMLITFTLPKKDGSVYDESFWDDEEESF